LKNLILSLLLILFSSISVSEPDTTCHQLDNHCIQYIRNELGIIVPVFIEQDSEINAYTNGTAIFITTGLLNTPKITTDSIKIILLHELGHIINRSHSVRDLYWKAYQAELDKCTTIECTDVAGIRFLREMKEDEYRCDSYAIKRGFSLRLDPEKACYIYKVFAELSNYELDDSESTHPSSVDRYKKCIIGVATGTIL